MMFFTLILVSSCLSLALAGTYCYARDGRTYTYSYCLYGCCDNDNVYKTCCSLPTGVIVGIVVGATAIIVIICVVVFLLKRRGRRTFVQRTTTGVALGPQIATTETSLSSQGQSTMGQPGPYIQAPGYGPPPQGYYPQAPPTQPPQYTKQTNTLEHSTSHRTPIG